MEDHLERVKEFEKRQLSDLKERQEVFQEAFEEDLQHFKLEGAVPSKLTYYALMTIIEVVVNLGLCCI